MCSPNVFKIGNRLFDEVDVAGLAGRRDLVEPVYHHRKQFLHSKVQEPK